MKAALILAVLLCASTVWATPLTFSELFQRGNVLDEQFKPKEALEYFLPAEAIQPGNAELMVRIARQYSFLMTDAPTADAKRQLGTKALGYAEKAVKLDPSLCDAHLSVAVCHGKLLPLLDTKHKLEASRIVKASADKAVALDPNNDLAWHLLGRWHQELAGIGGVKRAVAQLVYGKIPAASYEESARCLEKAAALQPARLMHHIELGRTYALMGRSDEARKLLKKGLAMNNTDKDDAETKRRGREALKKLGASNG